MILRRIGEVERAATDDAEGKGGLEWERIWNCVDYICWKLVGDCIIQSNGVVSHFRGSTDVLRQTCLFGLTFS